jgi:hypothetical protein
MSETYSSGSGGGAIPHESRDANALAAADWLSMAAAPTFAIMTLLSGVLGAGPSAMLCLSARDASPLAGMLGGMVPMYLLMTAFHSAPWLKLISGRLTGIRQS